MYKTSANYSSISDDEKIICVKYKLIETYTNKHQSKTI